MTSVIVIGAGLAGAAAAWRLSQLGHQVTVLERTAPANDLGSSHGSARIFRYDYADALHIEMVIAARAGWEELERAHGSGLMTATGAVDFGTGRDLAQLAGLLAHAGVDHEIVPVKEATHRWPIAFDTDVLWHPAAGVIDAAGAVGAMLNQAVVNGAQVLCHWPAALVQQTPAGYRVIRADGAACEAEQIVVAAGGWLPSLLDALTLPERFLASFPRLVVTQEQAYHFAYRDAGATWPTFIHKSADMQAYGLPGGRDAAWRGQKVAEYRAGRHIASALRHDKRIDDAGRRRVASYVARFLPGLDPRPYAEATCLFTSTPTEGFVIDRIEGITVLSPCSGHGAKFAPLIGQYAAALVEGSDAVPRVFRPSELVAQ